MNKLFTSLSLSNDEGKNALSCTLNIAYFV